MDQDPKSIFASKTFWGALIMAIVPVLALFHVNLTDTQIGQDASDLSLLGGFALTIYGRFAAKKPVTLTGAPSKPAQ